MELLLRVSLERDHDRRSPGDDMYFMRGTWISGDDSYWPTNTGPGVAAAILYQATGVRRFEKLASATMNHAIATYGEPNGSFSGTNASDIATMTFASQLGRTYLALGDGLPPRTAASWRAVMRGAADFLIRNGNLRWYTNGNVVLGNAEVMALAYRVTGDRRFMRAYRTAFAFAIAPSEPRWRGYGLHITTVPTLADGADGAGYLAESNGSDTPGFDPEYTELQLDVASRLFLLTHDMRSLRLANELANELLPHVDRTTWLLDTSGGTRHPQTGRFVPFTTSGVSILAWLGGRSDLLRLVPSQLAMVDHEYRGALTFSNRNYYRGLGDEIAPILQATGFRGDALAPAPSRH